MVNSSQLDKKGVSEMIGYVLLIAIALGLSVLVYIYLNLYIPKEKPECPLDTSLLIQDASCNVIYRLSATIPSKTELTLTLYNNGLHNIDASYIRFDKSDKKAKIWINDPSRPEIGDSNFYFYNSTSGKTGLSPGDRKYYNFAIDKTKFTEGDYLLEVQPAVFSNNLLSTCSSIITLPLKCIPINPPVPTCTDGIQNQGETGIDCGGPCPACVPQEGTIEFIGSPSNSFMYGFDKSYQTARSTPIYVHTPANGQNSIGQSFSNPFYVVLRTFYKFNTSSIPDSSTITQVRLKNAIVVDNSNTDFDIQIVKYSWQAQDPLTSANMGSAFNGCLGVTDSNRLINTAGISTGVSYVSGDLDASWVNKFGDTYYCLRSSRDKLEIAPTAIEDLTLDRPVLIVNYTTP